MKTPLPQHPLPPGACAMAPARQRYGRGLGAPLRARPLTDGLEPVTDGLEAVIDGSGARDG
ncbi:hypothetical protein EK904_000710 [Melospiza melodia maxima]|nr:hypothetical protein EK904_000710 [Melospiza melodia maxima]